MTSDDNLPLEKSSVWLKTFNLYIPLDVLKDPLEAVYPIKNLSIGFLEDEFEIYIAKTKDSYVKVAVYRNRVNRNKKHDDGYALRFYITVTGFDEEPQVSIMKHDDEKAEPFSFFKLSENILAKVNTNRHVFDVFVVAHMLEFKSLVSEENVDSIELVQYMSSFVKPRLTEKEQRDLCFILNCSELEDAFTGRLPDTHMADIFEFIEMMRENTAEVAEYLKARYNDEHSKSSNANLNNVLKYADLEDEQGPLPLYDAIVIYLQAQSIGLDYVKVIATDYLLSFLDKDYDSVVNVLHVALTAHDEDLLNKAIYSLLNNFHNIIRSEKFADYSESMAPYSRLIMHSARVWISNNEVYIPGWNQSAQSATA